MSSYSIKGLIKVGQGLCLDAFGGINKQKRTFASPDTSIHLIAEINVPLKNELATENCLTGVSIRLRR